MRCDANSELKTTDHSQILREDKRNEGQITQVRTVQL